MLDILDYVIGLPLSVGAFVRPNFPRVLFVCCDIIGFVVGDHFGVQMIAYSRVNVTEVHNLSPSVVVVFD